MWIYIANLIALSILMYAIGELTKIEGKVGYTYSIYPWITTFPETLTTLLLLIHGYVVGAMYNSIFSATFDLAFVIGLVALIRGTTEFRLRDLTLFTGFAGLLFMFLLFDGVIDTYDSVILYMLLMFVIVYSIARYGFIGRKVTVLEALKAVAGLVMLGIITYVFYLNIVGLIRSGVPEAIAGILSAGLTSVPDTIVAILYGLTTSEAQAEILGCIVHDFIENIPTSVIVANIVAGVRGMVDPNPVVTAVVTGFTVIAMMFTASYARVTRFEGALLIAVFIICCILVII